MSYETQNFLPKNIKIDKLFKFLELNDFVKYYGSAKSKKRLLQVFHGLKLKIINRGPA